MQCRLCKVNRAVIPDRNSMSYKKVMCLDCHKARLRQDLEHLLIRHYRKSLSQDTNDNEST
jgi:hypothetical protein